MEIEQAYSGLRSKRDPRQISDIAAREALRVRTLICVVTASLTFKFNYAKHHQVDPEESHRSSRHT